MAPQEACASCTLKAAEVDVGQFKFHLTLEVLHFPPEAFECIRLYYISRMLKGLHWSPADNVKCTQNIPVLKGPSDTFLLRLQAPAMLSVPLFPSPNS